jgi:NAD-reducing hydrogenase large subunit
MIEMLHAAEVIRSCSTTRTCSPTTAWPKAPAAARRRHHRSPRGTLIHHYRVGDDDLVSYCNLIVSTTHNNQAMNEAVRQVARRYLDGRQLTEGLLNHIEVAIRAFDPCLSCATHALGKMPLAVELLDADGSLVDSATSGAEADVVVVFAVGNPSRGDDALGPLLMAGSQAAARPASGW